jgi:low temperature requirement protein LtrA
METTAVFFTGALAMGFLVASVFFARFWRRTGDSLFAVFAIAFGLLALNQALVGLLDIPREEQTPVFALRLLAFVLIIAAILWKNVGGRRS